MAFKTAAGYGNLSNGNFSPVIYSKKVQSAFRKTSICEDITNSDYFGEIANFGDTVRIIKEPEITVQEYARGTQVQPQDLQDDDFTLVVDKANYFSFKIDDIEDAFDDELIEEILDEAKVTMGKGGRVPLSRDAGKGPGVTSGSGSKMAAASRLSRMKGAQKIARQKERKEKVKSAVKTGKDTAKAGVAKAKEAGREAKFQAVDKKVAAYANNRKLDNAPGLKARSKDPEKRRGLRAKVAGDIASRAKGKLDRRVKRATDTAKGVKAGAQIAGSIAKDEARRAGRKDRKSTRLNSSHSQQARMPSSA